MKRTLTVDELEHYHREGYVVVEDLFPQEDLREIDEDLDTFMRQEQYESFKSAGDNTQGWIMKLGLSTPKAAAFCADARILDLIEPIVYPGIAIYSAKLVAKAPHDGTICHWHQDDAYYTQMSQSETRMSVWIPLQDTTRAHGCLQVLPGSHRRGLQPYSKKEGGTCNLSIDTSIDVENRIYLPAPAGSIVLFSALLWHASDGNETAQRRRAFIVSYQEATVQGGNTNQWHILRNA